jgi:hypothetical protein
VGLTEPRLRQKALLSEELLDQPMAKEERTETDRHQLKEVQLQVDELLSKCNSTLLCRESVEKLIPTVYPGTGQWDYISEKAMTTNLVFPQIAGYLFYFHAEAPKLSKSDNFFTSENLWGSEDRLLPKADLEAWVEWL